MCPGFYMSWVLCVLGSMCPGFYVSWVLCALGSMCPEPYDVGIQCKLTKVTTPIGQEMVRGSCAYAGVKDCTCIHG